MTDENQNQIVPDQQASTEIDPILTNDLTGTSPDQPLLPANEYNLTVSKIEVATSEKSGNKMISMQLKTIDPATSVNGEHIPAGGLTLFHRIMITPSEKRTQDFIKRDLKRFMLACGIKSGAFYPLSQYEGKNLRAKVGFSKKTDDYPDDRNEVKSFVTG